MEATSDMRDGLRRPESVDDDDYTLTSYFDIKAAEILPLCSVISFHLIAQVLGLLRKFCLSSKKVFTDFHLRERL